MFSKIRWRLTVIFVLLIGLVMGGMTLALERPGCLDSAGCVRQVIWTTTLILGTTAVVVANLVAERTARPLRQLTTVIRRIIDGNWRVNLLPQSRDEAGTLIREFNRMTESLDQKITQLSESEQQLAAILNYMADGVLIIDQDGLVQLINPAAMRLLSTTEKSALGRSYAEVVRHHQLIELWQRCQDEGEEQVAAIEVGRDLFLQAVVSPFRDAENDNHLVILQDLTQIRRLETVRRDFISNLSHELRTPLTSIRAVVETLQDGALEDTAVAPRFLDRAVAEVDTMTQMVEELLELSRIESGKVPLQLSATAVSDLVSLPLERLQSQAERHGLAITIDIASDVPPVLADAERVQRVISNLLHNALKFTPDGGAIRIRAYEIDGDQVCFEIRDDGVGISDKDLPRIFERFYKTDRARTRGGSGTGLGLAISRHIVQAHNGRIWVKSKEGKGSTFYFTLPVAPGYGPS